MLFLSIGIRPNLDLMEDSKAHIKNGVLEVNEYLETGIPDVYALGDIVYSKNLITNKPVYAPFGDVADKQGLLLGNTLAGYPSPFRGVIGTAATSLFGLQIGMTGLSLSQAGEHGFKADSFEIKALYNVPGFGQEQGVVSVVYDTENDLLLGAQVISPQSAAAFTDIFAMVITLKIPVSEWIDFDFAYSPTTSVVWNPLLAAYRKIKKR